MAHNPDIDIDTQTTFIPEDVFPEWTRASMIHNDELRKHPVGMYPQNIPRDPISDLSAIPYKEADEYFKIDFLHVQIYDYFQSRDQITELLKVDPPWELLQSPSVVKQLFQLSKHYAEINKIKPTSVEELADVLALIRPGKIWLMDKYREDTEYVRRKLYERNKDDTYSFKKSHAIAYALIIVLQLHLISGGIEFDF